MHADFPLSIFVEEEGAIKLLPPWEIVFQYEKHYDIHTEQMIKGRIESVAVSLPFQTFKEPARTMTLQLIWYQPKFCC